MSTVNLKKKDRHELLRRMWDLGREMSTQTVFLHQAIAQSAGLNATDTKCIDLILRCENEHVTAGWLSQQSGLTTGAITHILDRLEKRRYIRRVRDTHDRRRVFITVNRASLKPLEPKYEAIGNAYVAMLEQFSDDQLQLICDYLEKTSEISRHELSKFTGKKQE
ncbi:MAG TPA: MarR family transcriptional regulator [Candidatus Acidoferrales bacterium]|jgi:DNA-binding MarR family transcriptional regulator|nr:MarR family transcriptional regulator [Candidatus Acidoferrales bacterium]